jgi:hypothetical protein
MESFGIDQQSKSGKRRRRPRRRRSQNPAQT